MRLALMSFAHVHAESYIGNLRAIPDATLIGVADDDSARGAHFASQYNVPLFTSYADLLAEKPDGVVICCENSRHRELVELVLKAGVRYILCEKPLATTLDDAHAILRAVETANAQLMVAFPVRFSPAIRDAKALIDAGKIGKVYGCNAINQGENPSYHRVWFGDKQLAGGGAMMDHIVHVVDVLRWLFQSELVELYAEGGDLFPAPGTTVDTAGTVMLQFDNGAFVGLDCSWSRPNYYPKWGNLKIDFVGERGLIAVDVFAQKFTMYRHTVGRPAWVDWGSDIDQALINEFAASIREGRAPAITGRDGLKAVEAVIAAYRSAETHQPVKLPL